MFHIQVFIVKMTLSRLRKSSQRKNADSLLGWGLDLTYSESISFEVASFKTILGLFEKVCHFRRSYNSSIVFVETLISPKPMAV